MKEEKNRYMIVEYAGTKQFQFDEKKDLEELLERVRKYNKRKTSKYICGNIHVDMLYGVYYVHMHLYHKLTSKHTISEIDNFTRNYSNSELEALFLPKLKFDAGYEADINIAYLETKNANEQTNDPLLFGVNYIPILYKDDLKYFDIEYIKKCLRYHAEKKDFGFFKEMANEFRYHHSVRKQVSKLFEYADKVQNQGFSIYTLSTYALELYNNLIYEREKDGSILRDNNGNYQVSIRRQRDFAFFIKNYNTSKKRTPYRYNGSTTKMKKDDLIKQRDEILSRSSGSKLELK